MSAQIKGMPWIKRKVYLTMFVGILVLGLIGNC